MFTDLRARNVKYFCPSERTVKILLGSGQEQMMGRIKHVRLPQVHGICSINKNLVASDLAAGTVKLVSGLSGTVRFLQVLGRRYDSFGIQGQSTGKTQVSLPDVVSNVSFLNDNIKKTISEVKQRHGMKEATATNGPEGTVSNKTQVSLTLLEQ